ncbi:CHASE3 domain-containing protein [Chitinophaga sp. CF418]|uniref:CHASE3 domain-containing protein n=1 Tax=Chitinophaga sp. CF418 TaxID=1855287 RepID=UPI000910BB46|nr:CHASE3 domain-containing protein [Chitinophaga sp. CF418]SHN07139.1 CHASE3 domain-containing protein [Chitinophaga sp. CF418]
MNVPPARLSDKLIKDESYLQKKSADWIWTITVLLVVSSVASFFSIRNLLQSAFWVDHTNAVIYRLENTLSFMKDAETGQRGYLLTGDEDFLEPYRRETGKMPGRRGGSLCCQTHWPGRFTGSPEK